MTDTNPDKPDKAINARLVYEHWLLLWHDEVAFASAIRTKRKTYSLGLALFAGLGFFKVEWYKPAEFEAVLGLTWTGVSIRILLFLALISILISAYRLFTERGVEKNPSVAEPSHGRANTALMLSSDTVKQCMEAPEHEVWLIRIASLKQGYERLVEANQRVNLRIKSGLFWMFLAYLLLLITLIVYTWIAT